MKPMVICLWFNGQAEEAAKFYTSVFKKSKMGDITRWGNVDQPHGGKPGSVLTVEFELNGTPFVGLNGGPEFQFNEAVSFQVSCDTQDEIDYYWKKLAEGGGVEVACGWLKDRYGVSWQVYPWKLTDLIKDKDQKKADRVMKAMMQMKKIDLAAIEKAARG